jgi:hypothetical protein
MRAGVCEAGASVNVRDVHERESSRMRRRIASMEYALSFLPSLDFELATRLRHHGGRGDGHLLPA